MQFKLKKLIVIFNMYLTHSHGLYKNVTFAFGMLKMRVINL